jgi:hypothetical protein
MKRALVLPANRMNWFSGLALVRVQAARLEALRITFDGGLPCNATFLTLLLTAMGAFAAATRSIPLRFL